MRNQQYYDYPPTNDFSPLRENYLLKVDDIAGAKPRIGHSTKNTNHYENKLTNNNPVFEYNHQMHEKLYHSGNYHQAGPNPFATAKKHYNVHHESEIARSGVMHGKEGAPQNLNYVDFPRNLTTEDIPGASPGTLQSKSVKNHDLAQKLRGQSHSVSPTKIPTTKDTLDHFKREQDFRRGQEMSQEQYRYAQNMPREPQRPARNTNNFHYGQYQLSNEQPRNSAQEQFYASPPQQQQQQEYRGNYNQSEQSSPLDERRSKHVAFKEEPREETPQYREQPSQYKEPFNPYGEPTYPYREQSQQDYLDSYATQNNEYSAGNQSMQEYQNSPMTPGSKQGLSTKRDQLDQLNQDIISQQQAMEKKVRETMRGRGFNIITNNISNNVMSETRRAYGSSIKAMTKNQEDTRGLGATAARGWAPAGQFNGTVGQGDNYGQYMQANQDVRKPDVAGGLNDYNETNYRYANKQGQMEPVPQGQYYGSKALKNMSGMRLY